MYLYFLLKTIFCLENLCIFYDLTSFVGSLGMFHEYCIYVTSGLRFFTVVTLL